MGLNAALSTASQSLQLFSAGVQVAGQNISNANTPGYIREQLELVPGQAAARGNLIFGSGAEATGVLQKIDLYLESRIHSANSDAETSAAREDIFLKLQSELQELSDNDLSTGLNNFLAAVNEVVNEPDSSGLRELAILQGQEFASQVGSLRTRLDDLRSAQTDKVESLVEEANRLIDQVDRLNDRIVTLEGAGHLGSDAGALRSERYEALNRLSEIVDIRVQENPEGRVDVFTGSDYLILAGTSQHLETVNQTDRGVLVNSVRLTQTKSDISGNGGEIQGLIEGRDQIIGGFIDDLDTFTSNLIFEFNKIHSSGEGLRGYDNISAEHAVSDVNAALNNAGLAFTPTHGSFQLKVVNKTTGIIETTDIPIDLDGIGGDDTTLEDLRAAIASVANISSATISSDRKLQISAADNYEIRFADDTSGVLAALGINSFFSGTDSGSIGINSVVAGDQAYFASSQGGGDADNRNAIALAEFADQSFSGLGDTTLDDFYNSAVSSVAQSAASETVLSNGLNGFRESLFNQRSQFSGVSLDEEAVHVLQFQQAFQAAARIVSTIDELFTTLLQL